MRSIVIGFALLLGLAAPALANQCPREIAALDQLIQEHGSMLTPQQQTEVKELRAEAEREHKAGRHVASLEAARKARSIINM